VETEKFQPRYQLEIDGTVHELGEAEFNGVLFEIVTTLVFEKLVDRVSFVLKASEAELIGSGGQHFDPLSVSLYRHLKVERCQGPVYPDLGGETQSFRLHAIVDALVAVAFFLKGGDVIPHMIVGGPDRPLLTVLDRGLRTLLTSDDPNLLAKLGRLIPS
jgi:hypothetical protein